MSCAAVPSGASTGIHKTVELRDGDKNAYLGKVHASASKAFSNVNNIIAPELINSRLRIQFKGLDTLGRVELGKLFRRRVVEVQPLFVDSVQRREMRAVVGVDGDGRQGHACAVSPPRMPPLPDVGAGTALSFSTHHPIPPSARTIRIALTAGLSPLRESRLVVLGGVAELIAGAISMGIGDFLASQAERDQYRFLRTATSARSSAFATARWSAKSPMCSPPSASNAPATQSPFSIARALAAITTLRIPSPLCLSLPGARRSRLRRAHFAHIRRCRAVGLGQVG
ncbi:hypothetical protein B0H11DRAFT_2256366 [Mycena galericulata]|nr:hypothetical protein B0H11DRAFT_2256366 [Mycena galericulata]